jgi:aquaporin Z
VTENHSSDVLTERAFAAVPETREDRKSIWSSATSALTQHWPEYLMEAAELGLFMISACVFTVLFEYPASPVHQSVPNPLFRNALIGLAMAGTAISLIYSGWGQRSGAHMNPAVTITFLRLKKMEPWDAFFYVIAQFAGGVIGVAAASIFLGMTLSHRAVRYAATQPGAPGIKSAFLAETLISFVLMLTVLNVSNSRKLSRFTGLFAGALIAAYITFEAPLSGMSMNPARTFGSAFFAKSFDSLWLYFVAPPMGMLLAAELFVRLRSLRAVHCAKYHHNNSKRCIFRCNYAELMKPEAAMTVQ